MVIWNIAWSCRSDIDKPFSRELTSLIFTEVMQLYPMDIFVRLDFFEIHTSLRFVMRSSPWSPLLPFVSSTGSYRYSLLGLDGEECMHDVSKSPACTYQSFYDAFTMPAIQITSWCIKFYFPVLRELVLGSSKQYVHGASPSKCNGWLPHTAT